MKETNKDTIRVSTLPAKYQKKLADRYGEVHPQDFLSGDKKTYFKFDGENKTTGSVTHRPINMPSFESMYLIYSKLVGSVKYLAKNQEIAGDKDARQLFDIIKTTYRQLQTYLRNERPEQYELMKMRRVMEEKTYKEIIEVLAEKKRPAKERGARKSDPKDKTRSKVPKATQYNEDDLGKGYTYARDIIAHLRENVYRKLNDQELEEFRREMYEHYKDVVAEDTTKEGLWANINAKKKAGKKSSHGNSNAHKDAVKAGNTLKQEGSEQVLNVGDRVSFKADPKAIWKILGIQGTTYRINQQGERSISYQPQSWLHNMIGTGKATVLAGNKLKETEHQGSNYKWPMSKATKDRKEADVAAQKAKRKAGNKLK